MRMGKGKVGSLALDLRAFAVVGHEPVDGGGAHLEELLADLGEIEFAVALQGLDDLGRGRRQGFAGRKARHGPHAAQCLLDRLVMERLAALAALAGSVSLLADPLHSTSKPLKYFVSSVAERRSFPREIRGHS